MAINKIWVVAEVAEGVPIPAAIETLTGARGLAGTVEAVTWGEGAEGAAASLADYGAEVVHKVAGTEGKLASAPVAAALAAACCGGEGPDAILIPQTYEGRDIAARLSAKLDRPVLTNVVGMEKKEDVLVTEHQVFGGATIVKAKFTDDGLGIFLVKPKSFAAEGGAGAAGSMSELASGDAGNTDAARIVNRHVEQTSGPKLDEAPIVVAGGRGLGEQDKFVMIEELAELLKGAPGATRAIVDAGWVPYSMQVGQTGKTVKPEVYIAAGISGATQHMVGMKGAKRIIAINKDSEAPIFQIADLGIVGDVHKVLPKLIEALKA